MIRSVHGPKPTVGTVFKVSMAGDGGGSCGESPERLQFDRLSFNCTDRV